MFRPYIIGTYEGLRAQMINDTCCVYVKDTAEAMSKLWALFKNGISAIYVTEEFYKDAVSLSDNAPAIRHHIKLLPSSRSGDIGTIKDIRLQITHAARSGGYDSIAV